MLQFVADCSHQELLLQRSKVLLTADHLPQTVCIHELVKLVRADYSGKRGTDVDTRQQPAQLEAVDQSAYECEATALASERSAGKAHHVRLVNHDRLIEVYNLALVHLPSPLAYHIEEELPHLSQAPEVRDFYRVDYLGDFHLSPCHKPEREVVLHSVVYK